MQPYQKATTCQVMGIVNVTPDSFSDGGKFFLPEEALRRAANIEREGATILDIGGESTRPGAEPIGWEEEWRRVEPVLAGYQGALPVSIDTYHTETAARALAYGATIVNCVRAERAAEMLALCAERGAQLVFPASALDLLDAALLARVPHWIDPMIGFDTTREEDLARLRSIRELAERGRVLVGVSRKRIVKRLTGAKVPGKDLAGNLTLAVWCALEGASVIRAHDVAETVQALAVVSSISLP